MGEGEAGTDVLTAEVTANSVGGKGLRGNGDLDLNSLSRSSSFPIPSHKPYFPSKSTP